MKLVLTAVVALYLALSSADPSLPGANSFDEESIAAIHLARMAAPAPPTIAATPAPVGVRATPRAPARLVRGRAPDVVHHVSDHSRRPAPDPSAPEAA